MTKLPKQTVTSLTIRLRNEETGKITSLTWDMRGWHVEWQEHCGGFRPPHYAGDERQIKLYSDGSRSLHIQALKQVDRKKVARAMRDALGLKL